MLLTVQGRFLTDRGPLDAFRRPHLKPLLTFSINPNITTTLFPRSMPWITSLDECDYFSIAPLHRYRYFVPLFYTEVMIIEEVHVTNPMNTNTNYITFSAYHTEMHETTSCALQIKKPSSLPTVRNTNIHL
jgi:hypothetical protein